MAPPLPPQPTAEIAAGDRPPAGACLALVVLVVLVVLSPWPFGSVHLRATQAIVLVALVTALIVLGWQWRGWSSGERPWDVDARTARVALCAFGLWALGAAQLVPLPRAVQTLLAPGSAAIWHPSVPAAAAVLGTGPHPISVYPAATARWLAFFAALVALALLAAPALRGRRAVLRVSAIVVVSAVVLALYAFVARLWFGGSLFGIYESLIPPFGPFVSKNHFAGYVEMAALLAVGLAAGLASENRDGSGLGWIEGPRASRIVLAWAAAAVLVLAVPVSLSRGGVVSLAAGLLAFVLMRAVTGRRAQHGPHVEDARPTRRLALPLVAGLGAVALFAGAVAFVLPESARARIATIGTGGGDSSSSYRLSLWRDTLRLAASSPIVGSGFGAFADAVPRFKAGAGDVRVEHAENDFLELLAESGLLGAGLATAALGLLFAAAWRALRCEPRRLARGVRTGALAGLVALLAHSLLDFNLHIPSNALLAGLLAAVVLAPVSARTASRAEEVDKPEGDAATGLRLPARASSSAFVLSTCAAAVVISFVLAFTAGWIEAGSLAAGLSARASSLRRNASERDVVAHLRGRPADAEAWLVLAWLRLPASPTDASDLARLSAGLDPTDERLTAAAARFIPR